MRIRIDVVILAWNDGEQLDDAVVSALMSEGVDIEVVVVDNGSDLPVSMVDPRVRVLRNEVNRGVAPARNQGVRATDAVWCACSTATPASRRDASESWRRPWTILPLP